MSNRRRGTAPLAYPPFAAPSDAPVADDFALSILYCVDIVDLKWSTKNVSKSVIKLDYYIVCPFPFYIFFLYFYFFLFFVDNDRRTKKNGEVLL